MASEATGEKTEAATPRRRQEARERGQVARSTEVNSALILLGTLGALALAGPVMGRTMVEAFQHGLQIGGRPDLGPEDVRRLFLWVAVTVGQVIAPVVLAGLVFGLAAGAMQVGFLVIPENVRFNWARLNPLNGLKGLLSTRGAVELLKAVFKMGTIGIVAYRTLRPEWDRVPELAQMGLLGLIGWEFHLVLVLAFKVTAAFCLLAALDYGYQRWKHEKSLRMTKAEIKQEAKQSEGDPQIRSRVRSIQRERAMRRMIQDVPSASVVVVNPTHIAVALRYDPETMRAPRVVAKGKRLVAERIVAAARAAGVPVIQDIPLARALEKLVPVGGEIPAALYRAVAQILAYVFARPARGVAAGARP